MRDFLLPVWPIGGESDTKFSLLVQNASKMGISGVLGEFCTGWARRGCEPGEFCTDTGPACGTKFSLLGENRSKRAVSGVLGEFCTGWARQANVPGEFCTGWARRTGYARRVLYRLGSSRLRAGRVLYRHRPRVRYKVLPARGKQVKKGGFGRAGRVLYRLGSSRLRAGRVLYRLGPPNWIRQESFVPVQRARAACRESFVPGPAEAAAPAARRARRNQAW